MGLSGGSMPELFTSDMVRASLASPIPAIPVPKPLRAEAFSIGKAYG